MSEQPNPNELPETDTLPVIDETSPEYKAGFQAGTEAQGGAGMTQFGRALAEPNIEIICANSSQAKAASNG